MRRVGEKFGGPNIGEAGKESQTSLEKKTTEAKRRKRGRRYMRDIKTLSSGT